MKKDSIFSLLVFISTAIVCLSISYINRRGVVNAENGLLLKSGLQGLFLLTVIFTGWLEMGKPHLTKALFTVRNLMLFAFCVLLISSVNQRISEFTTGFFGCCVFLFFLSEKKIYAINKVYYFVFLYVLLRVIGTIGTVEGFRFPEKLITFFALPLTFSLIRIEKNTSLHILRYFFRAMMIYMSCTLIYWWYNILYFKVNIVDWVTHKQQDLGGFPPYHWTSGWALYEHPSFISLVLLVGLISGFYLYYKKQKSSFVSTLGLTIFVAFIIATVLVMESRIGIVCVALVLVITGLYYMHLKMRYFKALLLVLVVVGMGSSFFLGKSMSGFISDNVRKTDYTLAIHYIKSHPWWGVGYHQEHLALKQQEQIMLDVLPPLPAPKTYTHNQLLGDMVQFGVVGAFFLLLLIYGLSRYSIKSNSYLLQLLMCVILAFMCIEEPLYVQGGITRFMVFLCFFIHISESNKSVKSYTVFRRSPKA